ncbi:MAG: shikimate dehydrogenase [Fibrobacteria bacterium]|nr:shikimate dehydrogenase [Fibrobacteria bacterium]
MNISGHTVPFAVLGHPIGHTLSPIMHNASFEALGKNSVYLAFNVAPEKLMSTLPAMRAMGFGGVNLTVPLKEVAYTGLLEIEDGLDESARLVGAVNTVVFPENGGMKGYNTDGYGFLRALEESFGEHIDKKSVLILGSGGAGRALAITCAIEGAKAICVADIDTVRAQKVKEELLALGKDVLVNVVSAGGNELIQACETVDLVIQATPVGMKKEDKPLLYTDAFHAGQMVFDLIYMFPETAILSEAKKSGARIANGLGMLLHQGALAYEHWTGEQARVAAMREALEHSVYG